MDQDCWLRQGGGPEEWICAQSTCCGGLGGGENVCLKRVCGGSDEGVGGKDLGGDTAAGV